MIHNTFKPLLIHADEGIVLLEENTVKSDLSEQVCIDVRSTLISSCNLFFHQSSTSAKSRTSCLHFQ